jgi:hypothetical protein
VGVRRAKAVMQVALMLTELARRRMAVRGAIGMGVFMRMRMRMRMSVIVIM